MGDADIKNCVFLVGKNVSVEHGCLLKWLSVIASRLAQLLGMTEKPKQSLGF